VGLDRTDRSRRRFPWWIVVVVAVIGAVAALVFVFQFQIKKALAPKPTALPPPPGASGGQALPPGVLYQTTFDDPAIAKDWELFDDSRISAAIKDSQLVVGVNALTDTGAWSGLNFSFDDFKLDVDAAKIAGPDDNGIIVMFRLTDKQNYDRFDISSDGYYAVSKVRNGLRTTVSDFPVMPSPAIRTGNATNHIRVTGRGSKFSFEVNGTPLKLCVAADGSSKPLWDQNGQCLGGVLADNWQDSDLPKGKIGLGAQGFVPHTGDLNPQPAVATIAFDNLVIKTPDAP
jgi:hypothetical protein